MANFIWTAILYFFTLSIVFVAYRTFMNDRKLENELRTANQIRMAQGLGRKVAPESGAAAGRTAPTVAPPGLPGLTTIPRGVAHAPARRPTTIPANIRRA